MNSLSPDLLPLLRQESTVLHCGDVCPPHCHISRWLFHVDPISVCLLSLALTIASVCASFQSQPSVCAGPQQDPYPRLVKRAQNQTRRYVVTVLPETSYTSCTHPMTSLAVPTKMKLPVLSTLLPHCREGWCSRCLSSWRLCICSVQTDLELDSFAGSMRGLM